MTPRGSGAAAIIKRTGVLVIPLRVFNLKKSTARAFAVPFNKFQATPTKQELGTS